MSAALAPGGSDDKQIVSSSVMHDDFEYTDLPSEKAGTVVDRRDMARMGRTQEFRVREILSDGSLSARIDLSIAELWPSANPRLCCWTDVHLGGNFYVSGRETVTGSNLIWVP